MAEIKPAPSIVPPRISPPTVIRTEIVRTNDCTALFSTTTEDRTIDSQGGDHLTADHTTGIVSATAENAPDNVGIFDRVVATDRGTTQPGPAGNAAVHGDIVDVNTRSDDARVIVGPPDNAAYGGIADRLRRQNRAARQSRSAFHRTCDRHIGNA
ncbi:MAG: hypothetical protein QM773_00015 [Hyphomonadaceae bacterium]